ncbi:hypothetical protein C2R22_24295 (plasmid) [Salinigranum rubrum]|uniref:Metallo-beta-lactamase domain-containing protein n=1 Tax=Salinigranum rubrum TaxID=755307 RepID=A0A2I8VRW2_9EURY|nr:N-acyl homoserine lactonase family protein [Salinigranum rubrum]AUV84653.1 hypothetical protein C2R22_24295 [Salinigranum rubrum]
MYTIHPIHCATIDSVKGKYTYLTDMGSAMAIPAISFLVTADDPDEDTVIVVDTGVQEPDGDGTVIGNEVDLGGPEPIVDGLAEQDLTPADVDYVILTHLHHDHSSNNDLFEEAEFFVQRAELDAAKDPLPPMAEYYLPENIDSLDHVETSIVDGGYRLREGIEILLTPGHSRGMQSVIVETAAGPHALIGDLAYCEHNLNPKTTSFVDASGREVQTTPLNWDYLPPGVLVDLEECYQSIERLRKRVGEAGRLVGGHDAAFLGNSLP